MKNALKFMFIFINLFGSNQWKQKILSTCTIDRRESSPSNVEARTGTPITGNGVREATIPETQAAH